MCEECWEKYGSPRIDTPAVREAARAIEDLYGYAAVGGGLHIVVDDFNIEDGNLEFCDGWIEDYHEPHGQYEAERACLDKLKSLSVYERASALALKRGYWHSGEEPTPDVPIYTYSLWRGRDWMLIAGTVLEEDDPSAVCVREFRAFGVEEAIAAAKRITGVA